MSVHVYVICISVYAGCFTTSLNVPWSHFTAQMICFITRLFDIKKPLYLKPTLVIAKLNTHF